MITKTSTTNLMLLAGMFLLAVFALIPADAFATGTMDLSTQSKRLAQQAAIIPRLIAVFAYVVGAFFAVKALMALKGFIESPDDNPVTSVLAYAAVSALLIMLPYIIEVATNTIKVGNTSGNLTSSAGDFKESGALGTN